LRQGTTTFERKHPDARVEYVEVWDIFYQAFLDPETFGAPNATCTDPKGEKCVSEVIFSRIGVSVLTYLVMGKYFASRD